MRLKNALPWHQPENILFKKPRPRQTSFGDHVTPGEVERQFSDLVEAVKTEVRSRHYSYRTETSYLDWVRRFIAFHDYASPGGLNALHKEDTY